MLNFVKNDKCFLGQSVSRHAKILGLNLSDHNIVSRDEKDWVCLIIISCEVIHSRKIYLLVINLARKWALMTKHSRAVQSYIPEGIVFIL